MLYNLENILDRERFKRRCNDLHRKRVIVELREKKPPRSIAQNAYLHLILGWYAMETGNTLEYVKENYFKRLCNAATFLSTRHDPHLGDVDVVRSTKDCDTGELTLAIDRFRNWSSQECGIYLPSPDEQEFLRQIEVELDRHKEWL